MTMFNNVRFANILIGLLLLTFALSGCASVVQALQPETTEVVSHGNEIGGYVELVDALRLAGATVEPAEEVEQPFFTVKGQKIKVNGAEVQVFEYADEAARQAESDLISPDGSDFGTTMVTWINQPNFWAKGRLIALYIGKDATTIELLTSVLGEPVTKHE